MRHAQHLALLQPVSKETVTSTYSASFTMPRQAGSLLILGLKRPLIGRNAFVEIEGEDYDGQSGAMKESSNDTTLGQSIAGDCWQLRLLRERGLQGCQRFRRRVASGRAERHHPRAARRFADRPADRYVPGDRHWRCLGDADVSADRDLGFRPLVRRVWRHASPQLAEVPDRRVLERGARRMVARAARLSSPEWAGVPATVSAAVRARADPRA